MTNQLILIIEDDSENRYYLEDELRNKNYPVLSVGNGKQGLRILETFPVLPHYILLDQDMPILDGQEFIEQLKKVSRYNSIHIIFMSFDPQDKTYAEENNLSFIQKPFKFNELLRLIEELR